MLAAAWPFGAAFNGDLLCLEPLFPEHNLAGRDRKGNVHRPVAVMRRNCTATKLHGLERAAAQEEKQHAARADVVGTQPLIAVDLFSPSTCS